MKNLIKTSIIAFALLFFCAVVSHAATVQSQVSYEDLDSNGKVLVTVEFETNYHQDNEGFADTVQNDGWTLSNNSMTKSYDVDNPLSIKSYTAYSGEDDDKEVSVIASPSRYEKNVEITPHSTITFVSSSNVSVAKIENGKIKTVDSGLTTINAVYDNEFPISFPLYVAEETPVTPDEGKTSNGTDFTKGTYAINKYGITIDGVGKEGNLFYKVDHEAIGAGSTESTDGLSLLSYSDSTSKYDVTPPDFQRILQTPGDIYIHLYEKTLDMPYTKFYDKKIERPAGPGINAFTDYTMSTQSRTQICFNLPYSIITGRKLTYKIGKIDDNDLLLAIKNGDPSAFTSLMEFARNQTNPIIEETVETNSSLGYDTDDEIFPGNKLVDGGYYYLYALLDGENGTYIPVESVTLAMASVYPSLEDCPWYLFFYGSSDFNFDGVTEPDVPDIKPDNKEDKKPSVLPKTGESILYISLAIGTVIVAIILHKKIKKF